MEMVIEHWRSCWPPWFGSFWFNSEHLRPHFSTGKPWGHYRHYNPHTCTARTSLFLTLLWQRTVLSEFQGPSDWVWWKETKELCWYSWGTFPWCRHNSLISGHLRKQQRAGPGTGGHGWFSGTINLQRCGCRFFSGGVGIPGSISVKIVCRYNVGKLWKPCIHMSWCV